MLIETARFFRDITNLLAASKPTQKGKGGDRFLCKEDNYDEQFQFEYRGPVTMKGKSEPMNVWFLSRSKPGPSDQ
ncbi:hypothetical protein GEV33_002233 [Tenebrio molitor]|uniref:Uncharacterized protein n=1 Tax=Tenebrio molitor TaxID=7067 RepID=A0A8J6HUT5_TENMO|nr:hypothetical protein GEV33_002233 [Tenebrio molitor]